MISKQHPKLSVVIPTRDRVDTLLHTLRTVTSQTYDNLEIIVSDNASEDLTREVVLGINDKRIKYTNTSQRIGMSENWEHGLSLVTGDYVMFLGDDDGLLPNACSDIATLIVATGAKSITWKKPNYTWPCVTQYPNMLNLTFRSDLVKMRSDILLKRFAAGKTSYGRLPVIYSSFISMDSISKIKLKTGNFFQCVTPDVYSGIVIAHEINNYLYSLRPFSINGGSKNSNGINQLLSKSKISLSFFSETNLDIDKDFPAIPGAISSCLGDAFAQANKRKLAGAYYFNRGRYYQNIFHELMTQHPTLKKSGLKTLAGLKLSKSLKAKVLGKIAVELNDSSVTEVSDSVYNVVAPTDEVMLQIDCDKFNVKNSFDACQLAGNILGKYKIPSNIIKTGYIAYILLAIKRKATSIIIKYILPF
jgi:glycosyltransferase involved in cell wall biosynthesis